MKRPTALALSALLLLSLSGCAGQSAGETQPAAPAADLAADINATAPAPPEPELPELPELRPLRDSYYAAQDTGAFDYFQNRSVQRFLTMWVTEATGVEDPVWDPATFARYTVVGHDLEVLRPDLELYSCGWSDGAGRCGFSVYIYDEGDPSIRNYGVYETTPAQYNLDAALSALAGPLRESGLDLPTTAAARVSWFDRINKRADQGILFRDAAGTACLYLLDGKDPALEQVGTPEAPALPQAEF